MEFVKTSIDLFGIRFDEPITTFTDLVVSAVCFYAFYQINRAHKKNNVAWNLKYYFLMMALATLISGVIGHGLLYLFSFEWKLPGWLFGMLAVALLARASINHAKPLMKKRVVHFFSWMNLIVLGVFLIITASQLNFFFVTMHSIYGLLCIVTALNLFVYKKQKCDASKLFLRAIGVSAISALVFINKKGISPWLNHLDISHLFMAFSAYLFYKGSKIMLAESLAPKELRSIPLEAAYNIKMVPLVGFANQRSTQ